MAQIAATELYEEFKRELARMMPTKAQYASDPVWTPIALTAATAALDNLARRHPPGSAGTVTQSCTSKNQREYLRLDLISYGSWETHDWALRVAFEHENRDSWQDELCKLCHVVADLCVLVSYYDFTRPQPLANVLQAAIDQMEQRGNRITRVPNRKWLFVFGPRVKSFSLNPPFVAYTLEGTKVQQLADPAPLNPAGWP